MCIFSRPVGPGRAPGRPPGRPGPSRLRPRPRRHRPDHGPPDAGPGRGGGLETDAFAYRHGARPAELTVRFRLENGGAQPVTLGFSSGQQYDVELIDARSGRVLRAWSDGRFFAQAGRQVRVDAQSPFTVEETLELVDRRGRPLQGLVVIRVKLTSSARPPRPRRPCGSADGGPDRPDRRAPPSAGRAACGPKPERTTSRATRRSLARRARAAHTPLVSVDEGLLARWVVDRGLVTPGQLQELSARRQRGDDRPLDQLLLAAGRLGPEHLERFRTEVAGGGRRTAADDSRAASASTRPGRVGELEPGAAVALRSGLAVTCRRLLGEGGMGVVYLVDDPQLGRPAALKLVRAGGASETRARRFARERHVTARLDHPGIPPVFEAGRMASGQDYLLMRFVDGRSLAKLIAERPAGEPRALLHALVKAAEAVAYAHSRGVVHRDLKPENVMVGAFGEVLVMDWGLARDLEQSPQEDRALRSALSVSERPGAVEVGLTREGAFVGTPGFAAPEQARGQDVDARADVFALGALLSSVLTGRAPFGGETGHELLAAVAAGEVVLPGERGPVRPELDAIAARALAPDLEGRYASATAFGADLLAYLEGRPVSVYRYGPVERGRRLVRRRPALFVGLALTLLAALAVTATRQLAAAGVRDAALGRARSEARVAWERVEGAPLPSGIAEAPPEERHPALEERTARSLTALVSAQRWHALAPGDADAAAARLRAALALGEVARLDGQWSLAEQALAEAAVVAPAAAAAARASLEAARTAEARRRREELEGLLAAAGRGDLARRPDGRQDAVFQIVRHSAPATVELLAGRLDEATAAMVAAERAVLEEAARPTAEEAGAGAEPLEGVAGLLARRAARPPGAAPSDADRALREALGGRLVRRAMRQTVDVEVGPDAVTAAALIDARVADAVGADLRVARLCVEALGRLPHRERSVPALGRYLRAEHDEVRALVAARALLRLGGEAALAYVAEARGRFSLTFDQRAAAALRRLGRERPPPEPGDQVERIAQGAWTRLERGDLQGALEGYDRVLELDPEHLKARHFRGYVRLRLGDVAGALADQDAVLARDPDMAQARRLRGAILLERGEPGRALEDLDRAVVLAPDDAEAWANRGLARLRLGDPVGAEQDLTRAVELAPGRPAWLQNRAVARVRRGDLQGALRDLSAAIERAGEAADLWRRRALVRRRLGDVRGALADLDQAIELDPRSADAWNDRGVTHLAAGDLARAQADSEEALRIDPGRAGTWGNLAEVRLQLGDVAGARQAYDRALAEEPGLASAWAGRGRLRHETGDLEGARADVERAVQLDPADGRLWINLASVLEEQGRYAEAVEAGSEGLRRSPHLVQGWWGRGRAHAGLGRLAEAERDLTRAIELRPDVTDFVDLRARVRLQRGDEAGAAEDLRRLLELAPDSPSAPRVRAELERLEGR